MRFLSAREVTLDRAWDAVDVAEIDGATVRLHWTDAPYVWHVNDGPELFVVLDGTVDMHWRMPGGPTQVATLAMGDVWSGVAGIEHRAVPHGEARVLVMEAPFGDTLVEGG